MSITLSLRDGEARLVEKLFEDEYLAAVVHVAQGEGLTFDNLSVDRVTKDGSWISTEESTIPSAVIYMNSGTRSDHLIVKRSGDEKYGLFRYEWIS